MKMKTKLYLSVMLISSSTVSLAQLNTDDFSTDVALVAEKSLVIRHSAATDYINNSHSVGKKLGELALWSRTVLDRVSRVCNITSGPNVTDCFPRDGVGATYSSNDFVRKAFVLTHQEQLDHNRLIFNTNREQAGTLPSGITLTERPLSNAQSLKVKLASEKAPNAVHKTPMRHIMDLWPELNEGNLSTFQVRNRDFNRDANIFDRYSPDNVGDGPFRMIGVINRLDRAGDYDDRGTSDTTRQARSLGEVHMIYGVVDRAYENETGVAYPHTFQLAYRLPPLDGNFEVLSESDTFRNDENILTNYTHPNLMLESSRTEWRIQMRRWARLWRQLTKTGGPTSIEFRNHLNTMIDKATTANNFVGFRNNSLIKGRYDETSKSYVGAEFELRSWYLNGGNRDLLTRKPRREPYRCSVDGEDLPRILSGYFNNNYNDLDVTTYDPRNPTRRGLNGYTIPRDVRDYGNAAAPVQFSSGRRFLDGCTNIAGLPPFELLPTQGFNVEYAAYIAPFARTDREYVWQFPANNFVPEEQRHAFAIRTCSGCHGGETDTNGFHMENRLDSKVYTRLSEYLNNDGNLVDHNGVTYDFSTISDRKEWVSRAANYDRTLKVSEGMIRNDVHGF